MALIKRNSERGADIAPRFFYHDYKFDFNQSPPVNDIVLKINDKNIGSFGGLVVLTGKPKARKSTFLHFILASAIKNINVFGIETFLPDHKNHVVLIDTEQNNYELYNSMHRMCKIAGLQINELQKYPFDLYSTRQLEIDLTTKLIDEILQNNPNVGIICIDGLIDLITDINDVKESKAVIQKIKFWIDKYKVLIIGILHQNKSTNFSLGHLGSFASRFAQAEMQVIKNDDDTSTLEPVYLRSDANFNPVTISFDSSSNTYKTANNFNSNIDWKNANHQKLIDGIFKENDFFKYFEIENLLHQSYNSSKYMVKNHIVGFLIEQKYIVKTPNGYTKYR